MNEQKSKGIVGRKLPIPPAALIAGAAVLALAVVLGGAYLGLCRWVQGNGCLLPGTVAASEDGQVSVNLGKVSQESAVEQIEGYMDDYLSQRALILEYGEGQQVSLSGSLLEADPQGAVERGMEHKAQ